MRIVGWWWSVPVGIFASTLSVACHSARGSRQAGPVPTPPVTAIVGATVIDGTGAPPRRDATVLVQGAYIRAVGPRRGVQVPVEAEVIDGRGLFVLPGFVDGNTWGFAGYTVVQYGVTTVRDNDLGLKMAIRAWGRDSIRPRIVARGPVLGWEDNETVRKSYRTDSGRVGQPDLMGLDIDSLRVRINRYLDAGYDYLKYGATAHISGLIPFSTRAQRVIVEEVHKRGGAVDVHATGVEGLRMAVLAGVDNIVHAEVNEEAHLRADERPWPDDLVHLLVKRRVVCMLMPTYHRYAQNRPHRLRSRTELANGRKLVQAGCTIAVMTDGTNGLETLEAIILLVTDYGMTPMAAIVAATRNGALASKMLDQFGTVTAGKRADLVVLRADPLQDIKHIGQTAMVFADGRRVDVSPAKRDRRLNEDGTPRQYWDWAAMTWQAVSRP